MSSNTISLSTPVGVDMAWQVKLSGPTGTTWPYTTADGLSCDVYDGNATGVVFSPTIAWLDAPNGKIKISVAASQTAALAVGEYPLEILLLPASTSLRIAGPPGVLILKPASGSVALDPVYTTYDRMVELAPWIIQCFDPNVHQVGFRRERATARKILDDIILRLYRNTSIGAFASLYVAAVSWAGGGHRRTFLPSTVIQGYLTNNLLFVDDKIDRINAWLAIAEVDRQQVGVNNQLARYGEAARETASSLISTCNATISVNNDGVPTIAIPLSAANTFFT